MATWFLETGLYLLGVVLVPAVGLLLVCWGLWGYRIMRRMPLCTPRSPKPACLAILRIEVARMSADE